LFEKENVFTVKKFEFIRAGEKVYMCRWKSLYVQVKKFICAGEKVYMYRW